MEGLPPQKQRIGVYSVRVYVLAFVVLATLAVAYGNHIGSTTVFNAQTDSAAVAELGKTDSGSVATETPLLQPPQAEPLAVASSDVPDSSAVIGSLLNITGGTLKLLLAETASFQNQMSGLADHHDSFQIRDNVIGIENGGTGLTSIGTGAMLYADAHNSLKKLGIGSNGQVLTVSAGGVPTWEDANSTSSVSFSGGHLTVSYITATSTSATSTFANGIDISSGCFAVNGTCIGSGGGATTFTGLTDTQSTLTANRILFTNASGTALTDTADFVFDGTNLGIGSTSPSRKLTVANGLLYVGGTGTSTITDNLAVKGHLKVGTASLYITNTSIQNLSGDLTLQPKSGNVGIGTSSPSAKFTIQGDVGGSSALFAIASSTGTSMFSIGSQGQLVLNTTATSTFGHGIDIQSGCLRVNGNCIKGNGFTTSGNNTVFSSATGSVSIGTSTPGARLTIHGSNNQTNNLFEISSSTGDSLITITKNGKLISSSTATSTFANGIDVKSGCLAVNGTCVHSGGFSSDGGYTTLGSSDDNVGIGTSSPSEKLVVAGNMQLVGATSGWDISSASYDSTSFDLTGELVNPLGVDFKPDGTKMYAVGYGYDTVFQYSLSTPWDVSSASYDSKSYDVGSQDGVPEDVVFSSDGTKMYVVGNSGDKVYQYTLSTPWDVSSASNDGTPLDVSGQLSSPSGAAFKFDGTKLYVIGGNTNTVFQYTLSTAWDLSTATYDSVSYNVYSVVSEYNAIDVAFKSDGTKMLVVGNGLDKVFQFSLSTPWDVSTASYDSVSTSISGQEGNSQDVAFKSDGTKMFVTGTDSDTIYQYTTSGSSGGDFYAAGNVGIGTSSPSSQLSIQDNSGGTRDLFSAVSSAGTNFFTIDADGNVGIGSSSPASSLSLEGTAGQSANLFTIASSSNAKLFTVTANGNVGVGDSSPSSNFVVQGNTGQSANLFSIASSTGTSLFSISSTGTITSASVGTSTFANGINITSGCFAVNGTCLNGDAPIWSQNGSDAYYNTGNVGIGTSSPAYALDIYGGNVHIDKHVIGSWDLGAGVTFDTGVSPSGLSDIMFAFKSDGSKAYLASSGSTTVRQYSVSTPWDIDTLSYDSVYVPLGKQLNAMTISSDGTKLYGIATDAVIYQYDISSAWDLSTAATTTASSFDPAGQVSSPTAVQFKSDGTKMYVLNNITGTVYQYSLSPAWDVSSASYDSVSFDPTALDDYGFGYVQGFAFSSDGTTMFAAANNPDYVYQYDLSTPWDLSTAADGNTSVNLRTPSHTGSSPYALELGFAANGSKLYISSESDPAGLLQEYSVSTTTGGTLFADSALSVGTTTSSKVLTVDGDVLFAGLSNGTGNSVQITSNHEIVENVSSRVYKDNIADLPYDPGDLYNLRPVSFTWNDKSATPGQQDFGLIAEEVASTSPELAFYDSSGKPKSVRYNLLSVLLLDELKRRENILSVAGATSSAPTLQSFFAGTTTPAIVVDAEGHVGIGKDPSQYGAGSSTLEQALTIDGTVAATGFENVSSEKFKDNIKHLSDTQKQSMLDKLRNLFVSTYYYKRDEHASTTERLGVIAEEAPNEIRSTGGQGIDIYKFISFVASAVQALADKFDALASSVTGNEDRIAKLEAEVAALKAKDSGVSGSPSYNPSDQGTDINGSTDAEQGVTSTSSDTGTDNTVSSTTDTSTGTTTIEKDITPPTITLFGGTDIELTMGDTYVDPGYSATDGIDGDISSGVTVGGDNVDTKTPGTYKVTYNVTDTSGNAASEKVRTVTVVATLPDSGQVNVGIGTSTVNGA